jgi:enamine deaminase RidA (YjgF/YER057c/UK114 family)
MEEKMVADISRRQTNARMSKIVTYGGLIFLAGQTASSTDAVGIEDQAREVLRRVDSLLGEAGSDKGRLLSVTIFLRDMQDFAAMNAVWEAWLPQGCAPARATLQAAMASPHLLVEMSVVAAGA